MNASQFVCLWNSRLFLSYRIFFWMVPRLCMIIHSIFSRLDLGDYLDQIKPWVLSWLFCEWCCPCLFGSIYTTLRESWNFDSSPLIPFDWCLSYSSDWSLGCMLMSAGCQYLLHLEFLCCCGLRVLFGFFQKHSGLFGYTFHVYFNGWPKVVVLVCLMFLLVITRLYLW